MSTVSTETAREAAERARALDQPAFISIAEDAALARAEERASGTPLAGMAFAVKDNIDVARMPTTAGNPRRGVTAERHSTAVQRLVDAGGVPIGKTNLDQYATGLVGTRSPYGACHSVVSPAHVSGGSSSGSAVAVAAGVVPFALGTDTAGSGRVPAAFNGLVGWKPTRGLVSTRGVVPACPSLDCVTTLTRDVATAQRLAPLVAGYDAHDPWSRKAAVPPAGIAAHMNVVAVPAGPLDLDPPHAEAWSAALARARELFHVVEVDITPFLEAARLLYEGPWVAERLAAFGDELATDGPHLDPTVRTIVLGGRRVTGVDTFRGLARLAALREEAARTFAHADALLLPVTPGHPSLEEVAADPVGTNSRLGTFTNMVNLLDLCAVAVPAGQRADGLPFGVQLLAPAFADEPLLDLAARWSGEASAPADVPSGRVGLVVVGAHLSGEPLNSQLAGRGGRLLRRVRTAPSYRMHLLPGSPDRPALVPAAPGEGRAFEAEVWELAPAAVGELVPTVAKPLGLGAVALEDGTTLPGFVFAGRAHDLAGDLSAYSGWRAFRSTGSGVPERCDS